MPAMAERGKPMKSQAQKTCEKKIRSFYTKAERNTIQTILAENPQMTGAQMVQLLTEKEIPCYSSVGWKESNLSPVRIMLVGRRYKYFTKRSKHEMVEARMHTPAMIQPRKYEKKVTTTSPDADHFLLDVIATKHLSREDKIKVLTALL
jgi:hypothetical protein